MVLSGIDGLTGSQAKVVEAGYDNSKMSNEDFLKVLLADIQYQNPLEAKDISEFINDTVKLREMEVMNSFESTIKLLDSANSSNALLQASSIIGKNIQYEGSSTYIKGGKGSIEFKLESDADLVKVNLVDKDGNVVLSNTFANLKGGVLYPFEIDSSTLGDGYYTAYIEGYKDGKAVASTIYSQAVAEGVVRRDGKLFVYFDNKELEIEKITQIGG